MIDVTFSAGGTLTSDLSFGLTLISTLCCCSLLAWLFLRRFEYFMQDYRAVFKETATNNLNDIFLFVDPQRLFIINMLALVMLPILGLMLTSDLFVALVLFVVALVGPSWLYHHLKRQRLSRFEAQLPDALVMISGSLGSGASLTMALDSVLHEQQAPLSQEFMLLVREQRIGVDFDVSLRNMERRLPLQDFMMFTSALRISREVGGDLGELLNTLAQTLRRKAEMEGKIRALTAQGRMQGIVMTGLPVLLGVLLMFMEPEAMSKLFSTTYGWGLLTVIFVMETIGYLFIRKITTIDV